MSHLCIKVLAFRGIYRFLQVSQAIAVAAISAAEIHELKARRSNEATTDEWFWDKGVAYIREQPWQTAATSFRKVVDVFGWLPSHRDSFWPNVIHLLSYGPVIVFGSLGHVD